MRPVGLARGASAFVAAWCIAGAIALLTGASSVVMMLVASAVTAAAAVVAGPLQLRGAAVRSVVLPEAGTTGEAVHAVVEVQSRRPVHVEVRPHRADPPIASGWVRTNGAGPTSGSVRGVAGRRGRIDQVEVRLATAGRMGLVWWARRTTVPTAAMWVAPAAADTPAPVAFHEGDERGTSTTTARPGHDDLDSIRAWRDGDEVAGIHWPSSMRANEVMVRQQRAASVLRQVAQASTGTGQATVEAAAVRAAADLARTHGALPAVAVDGGEPVDLPSDDATLRWCAEFESGEAPPEHLPWWKRPIGGSQTEPDNSLTRAARWWVALGCMPPTVMVLQPLGYGAVHAAAAVAGIIGGAAVTTTRRPVARLLRQIAGLVCALGLGALLIDPTAVHSTVDALRFVMPQLLVALFVMQGFECVDRRAARVTLAVSAVLIAYSGGVRVDAGLGPWLALAVVALAAGSQAVAAVDRKAPPTTQVAPAARGARRSARAKAVAMPLVGVVAVAAVTVGALALVPIPRGPAQLTLPSWLESRQETAGDGSLATTSGSPLLGGAAQGSGKRSGAGAGGYPGFSNEMNTALRGDLGDEVVFRVRAPAPDFWKGQTFTRFDGTTWYVDDDLGTRSEGPDHDINTAVGDVLWTDEESSFVQTFYLEADLPNIVFAAQRPTRVLLDAPIWQRPDGALRADVVLPAGSAYTVLSTQSGATAESLAAQGDLAALRSPAEFVQLPDSTTERTRALAQELARGTTSTYEVIQRIEAWLEAHTEYDLDAPVPPAGWDAVDHFLFESQLGFCEQIASATAVLLRSLGVPARIATGYVPSERDEIAGVWVSRARDAHAWVEVRFPEDGWVAFDPTASVPLSGETGTLTVGADLVKAIARAVAAAAPYLLLVAAAWATLAMLRRAVRHGRAQRRRGRWGELQDRFAEAAVRRGAAANAPNAHLAAVFDAADARWLAEELDAAAFAASWEDSDERFQRGRAAVAACEQMAAAGN